MTNEALRGTGRTTRKMLEAPHGAVYIWVNGALHYPKDLAHHLGRKDLIIVAPAWLEDQRHRGTKFSDLVLDHAVQLNPRMWNLYKIACADARKSV